MKTKKKYLFNMPYIGIDRYRDLDILYNQNGDFCIIISLLNPVLQYSADPNNYDLFHRLYVNMIKILGEGYVIQKQDVLSKTVYNTSESTGYLQKKYDAHFHGRTYTRFQTYLVITRKALNSVYSFSEKQFADFEKGLGKILDLFKGSGLKANVLDKKNINSYILKILSMEFESPHLFLNNLLAGDEQVEMGKKAVKNLPLINTDVVDLPEVLGNYVERNDAGGLDGFPTDIMAFLFNVPDFETIVYNQVIDVVQQTATQRKLELKRKRHLGFPDPANNLCVEDIDRLLEDISRNNQLLVNTHFNIAIAANKDQIEGAGNYIESSLFKQGIIPSKNAYNQLELFRTLLPGNTSDLKEYDWFLTSSDAAACFLFKERTSSDEKSGFQLRFTDRRGIPIKIDLSDLPMQTNRISNRNKFVLGPSGSGKSFFMNALAEQYCMHNHNPNPKWEMDVVIVDVGHSYSGLCSYMKGNYITYSEDDPITTNPFAITKEEFNLEKKDYLQSLICLLWKSTEGAVTQVEADVISSTLTSYYTSYFEDEGKVQYLGFNSFYEYALEKIPQIKGEEKIPFNVEEFRFVLKKFYKNGELEALLNKKMDHSLLEEPLIVFEIDSIKENKVLFPIVTLIIMDVFIQKMRLRDKQRKALVIEEAWKAIASPLMAEYIQYMYKTVRKFWGEVIVVTQELGDIIGNPIVKDSIISNSDTVILLDQTKFKDNYDQIASLLSLNEHERKKIFTINQLDNSTGRGRFKEVYIKRGATGEVYGVEVSLQQYLTYTTERPEKEAVGIYVNEYGDYENGLDAFVEDYQESGLTLGTFFSEVNKLGRPIGKRGSHLKQA